MEQRKRLKVKESVTGWSHGAKRATECDGIGDLSWRYAVINRMKFRTFDMGFLCMAAVFFAMKDLHE